MAIVGLESLLANQGAVSTPQSSRSEGDMLAEDFFRLLTTQLQYQDPLKPMENQDTSAMMAQITALEQQKQMTSSINDMAQLTASINNMTALSFVGREVNARGNTVVYEGDPVNLSYELGDDASEVRVSIYNESGKLVRVIEEGSVNEGEASVSWDGKDQNGKDAADGRYIFTVEATKPDGAKVSSMTYTEGTVTGVRYENGVTYLKVGDKEVTISDVRTITG